MKRVDEEFSYTPSVITFINITWIRACYLNNTAVLNRIRNDTRFTTWIRRGTLMTFTFENVEVDIYSNGCRCKIFRHIEFTQPLDIDSVRRMHDILNRYIFNPEYYKLFLFFQANKLNKDVLIVLKDFLCF